MYKHQSAFFPTTCCRLLWSRVCEWSMYWPFEVLVWKWVEWYRLQWMWVYANVALYVIMHSMPVAHYGIKSIQMYIAIRHTYTGNWYTLYCDSRVPAWYKCTSEWVPYILYSTYVCLTSYIAYNVMLCRLLWPPMHQWKMHWSTNLHLQPWMDRRSVWPRWACRPDEATVNIQLQLFYNYTDKLYVYNIFIIIYSEFYLYLYLSIHLSTYIYYLLYT